MSGLEKSYQKRKRKPKQRNALNKAQKSQVKNMIERELFEELELKHKDTQVTTTVDTSFTTGVADISAISQGILDTQRIGDNASLKSVQGRFVIKASDSTNIMRVLCIQWRLDSSITSPALNEILQQTSGAIPEDILSPYKLDKDKKYKVLWDKIFNMTLNSDTHQHIVEFYINKGFQKEIQFTEAATSGYNKIYMLFVSDSGATPHPPIDGWFRLRYTDA